MATSPAHVKVYSSSIPVSVWGGLALVAIALAIMWAVPAARLVVGSGLLGGLVLAGGLWMRRRKALAGETPDTPLHLRD